MPAASYSSSISWGIYFAASFVLVLICSPILDGARGYAYADSVAETGEGVVRVLDSLNPGLVVRFAFHSPSPDGRVELSGHHVTVAWGAKSATFETVWLLPAKTLQPGVQYGLRVSGAQVEVFELV